MTLPTGMPGPADDPRRSGELLSLIFDHAAEGIGVFDAELRLSAWNARYLVLSGLDPALAQRGAPLLPLLVAMARAGQFGPCIDEAQVQQVATQRLAWLADDRNASMQRLRPDGRTIEMRRNPTPGGGFVVLYLDITERIAAEAQLAAGQRMLTLLQQHTEQGFWFIDNALETTDVNPAMCRMLGLPREQLLGRSIFDFVDEANAEVFREHAARRRRGLAEGYEVTLRRADGSLVHCYNNATPTFDASGHQTGALGLMSDISALKRAEQQVRSSGEMLAQKSRLLEATLDSLAQGVLSIDAQGRISGWNRRLLTLLEIDEATIRAHPDFDALVRYQVERGQIDDGPSIGMSRPAVYQRRRRDGSVLEVQTHTAVDGSAVRTYTDVTERERAQQALRASEARFRSMADAAPALIWQCDLQGNAIWFNQRWLQATGRSMSEELARFWVDRIHPDDLERCRAAFREARQAGIAFSSEYRLRDDEGGRLRWIADRGIPRTGDDGQVDGYLVYGWDITEAKRVEAELTAARDEAERANRAKSEFLSRMSHELRTPLNAVLGFGQLMATDSAEPLGAMQRNRLQELLRGGRHLLSLINEVLDLARIEAGALQLQLATVDLAELADDCLRLVQPTAADSGVLLQALPQPAAALTVQADRTRLKQVLLNLLSNAIKYSRPGARVQLAWTLEPGGQQVRVAVSDNGPGLSAAQQARLFQPFERLGAETSAVEGAGIGLALSKWLVELMHGEIGVSSSPGQGSCFWLRLDRGVGGAAPAGGVPAPEPAAAPARAAARAATGDRDGAAPPPRHTVLYIEDNPINQILMEGMLAQRPGIRLLVAGLPEVGLGIALQARPDLVLLDIQLPGIDGYEVLRRLRAHPSTRHIPVVAVSANAMPADLAEGARAGFTDYVTKPLDLPVLLEAVDRALAG
jgi:PAS domain S-box-containing protein